jgi:hypothetical protein
LFYLPKQPWSFCNGIGVNYAQAAANLDPSIEKQNNFAQSSVFLACHQSSDDKRKILIAFVCFSVQTFQLYILALARKTGCIKV